MLMYLHKITTSPNFAIFILPHKIVLTNKLGHNYQDVDTHL